MIDFLMANPWVVVPGLALLIPILGVVLGTITSCMTSVRRAEIEAALKQDMLNRGMSAEEIKLVIEASASKTSRGCKSEVASRSENP